MFKKKTKMKEVDERFVSKRSQPEKKRKGRVTEQPLGFSPKSIASGGVWRPNASINNLEQQQKKEVDKQISEKNKKKRRRMRLRLTLRASLLVLSALAVFFLIGSSSKRVNLSLDSGKDTEYETELSDSINSEVNGGIIGIIKPAFLRYRDIERKLMSSRDEVGLADLHFNIFKMRTEARVVTNKPLVKWTSTGGEPSYVNQKGEVFEPPASFVGLFNPLEISGSGIGAEPGSRVLASSEKLAWVVGVIPVLREQGIEPSRVNIDGQSFKSVEVLLAGVETRIIFSIDEDVTRSGIAAARSIKFIQKGGAEALKGVGYIDVRTPERVVYR